MSTKKNDGGVDQLMAELEHPHKQAINDLRAAILGLHAAISEEVKWNAPSYKLQDHFATFKLHPPKNIQIVLHRGAKPKPLDQAMALDDPHKLLKWAADDRCVITLNSSEQAAELQGEVCRLIGEWIEQL